ncbi:MAG: hypothetical protein AB7F89_05225 [Pirellulaceae bacterium]
MRHDHGDFDDVDEDTADGSGDEWDGDEADEDQDESPDGATMDCPMCGEEIYDDATWCPFCDQYLTQEQARPRRLGWWFWLGMGACFAAVLIWVFLG